MSLTPEDQKVKWKTSPTAPRSLKPGFVLKFHVHLSQVFIICMHDDLVIPHISQYILAIAPKQVHLPFLNAMYSVDHYKWRIKSAIVNCLNIKSTA